MATMNMTSVVPTFPAPPGVTPNFANPYSLGPIFYMVGGSMLFSMLMLVGMRVWIKFFMLRKPYWDDFICCVGTLGTIFFFVTICYCIIRAKYGTHIWNVPIALTETRQFLIPSWIIISWPSLIAPFIKSSIFIMYLQIFSVVTWFRICCQIGIAILWLFYIPVWITLLYFTSPSPGQTWVEAFGNARFTRSLKLSVPIASVALFLDVCLLILPIAVVLRLQMSKQRKLGVCLIACIASAISIVYRVKQNRDSPDVTWESFAIIFTQFVEMAVGVSISCIPSASLFYRTFCRNRLQSVMGKSSGSDSTSKGFSSPDSRPKKKLISMNHIDTYESFDDFQQEDDEIPLRKSVELSTMKTARTVVTHGKSNNLAPNGMHQKWLENVV